MAPRIHVSLAFLALAAACSHRPSSELQEADKMLAAGDARGALARLESLRAHSGASTDLLLRVARAYEQENEIGRAVATYKEGLQADPRASELWVGLGKIYLGLEQYEPARGAFLSARSAGAPDDKISVDLATCQAQLGDLKTADAEFEKARAAGLPATMIDYDVAVLRIGQGEREKGVAMLEAILAREPDHHQAQRELAQALLAGQPDAASVQRALSLAWPAVQAMPADWRAQDVIGQVYLAQKDWEAAKAAFVEALRLGHNPPRVEAHYVLAEEMRRASQKIGPPRPEPSPLH